MANGTEYDTSQLDVVQHPRLGTLRFPREMPYDERNELIDKLDKQAHEERAARARPPGIRLGGEEPKTTGEWLAKTGAEALEAGGRLGAGMLQFGKDVIRAGTPAEPVFMGPHSFAEKYLMGPARAERETASKYWERPDIGSKIAAGGHILASALPLMGPFAAQAGEELGRREYGAAAVDVPAALMGGRELARGGMKGVTDLRQASRDFLEPRNLRLGVEQVGKGAGIPTGEAAVRLAERGARGPAKFADDLAVARDDLAVIEREHPVASKGPEATFQRAENVLNHADRLWQEAHEPQIARHAQMPLDKTGIVQRALGEIGPEDRRVNAGGSRLAEKWVRDAFSGDLDLRQADNMIRRLNAEIRELPEKYGPIGKRVRQAALDGLRAQVDRQLVDTGESGVLEFNRRWGALQSVAERMINSASQEARAAGREGIIPRWAHLYTFLHPSPEGVAMSVGMGVRPGGMLSPTSSGLIGRGMGRLARTSVEPPAPIIPPYVGRKPIALLPAMGATGPTRSTFGIEPQAARVSTVMNPRPFEMGGIEQGGPLARIPGRAYHAPGEIRMGPSPLMTPVREVPAREPRPGESYVPSKHEEGKAVGRERKRRILHRRTER